MHKVGIFTFVVVLLLCAEPLIPLDSIDGIAHFNKLKLWFHETKSIPLEIESVDAQYMTEYRIQKEYERALLDAETPITMNSSLRYYMRDYDPDPSRDEINSKFSLGLQYRFLKNGLVDKKRKLETINVQLVEDSLLWAAKVTSRKYDAYRYEVILSAQDRVYELQVQYVAFLKSYVDLAKRHYFNKKLAKEKYEELLQLYEENKLLTELMQKRSTHEAASLPILVLKKELHSYENRSKSTTKEYQKRYREKISLNASIAGEIYPRYDDAIGNLVAGVQLSLPIAPVKKVNTSFDKRMKSFEKEQTKAAEHNARIEWERVQSEYYDAAADLARLLARESKRNLAVEREYFNITHFETTPDFLSIYRQIDTYFRAVGDLIELKKRVLLKLIRIAEMNESSDLLEIAEKRAQETTVADLVRNGERSLYLWRRSFDAITPQYLSKFCHLRNISRIYVSASRYKKSDPTIVSLEKSGLEIMPLYSENSWAKTEKHEKALQRIASLTKETKEIHLDVEPHALDNWRDNDYELLKEFVELLRKIRASYSGTISVSIPGIYPETYYPEIYQHVDRVEFMIYGKSKERTIEKLSQIIDTSITTSLAVRATDFANEQEMETFAEYALEQGVKHITLFDFASYRELVSK